MNIGTCSICGGVVSIPDVWCSILPPVPTCCSCGATAAQHGPIIQMTPPKFNITYTVNAEASTPIRHRANEQYGETKYTI